MGDFDPSLPAVANGSGLIVRRASKADLDDIAKVAQAGFPDDPEFNYRFPYRHKYPEDNWKWTRREYEGYIDQPEKFAVLVVTVTVSESDKAVERPIALAVWDMAVLTEPTGGGLGISSGAHKSDAESAADHLQMGASTSVAMQIPCT
jgi:hypothetical protein